VQHLHCWFDQEPVNVAVEAPVEIERWWATSDSGSMPFSGNPWINRASYRPYLASSPTLCWKRR